MAANVKQPRLQGALSLAQRVCDTGLHGECVHYTKDTIGYQIANTTILTLIVFNFSTGPNGILIFHRSSTNESINRNCTKYWK